MVEGDDVEALRQVGGVRVDDVLEVLGEAFVEGIQVHTAMDHSQQSEELVGGQVLDDCLFEL